MYHISQIAPLFDTGRHQDAALRSMKTVPGAWWLSDHDRQQVAALGFTETSPGA